MHPLTGSDKYYADIIRFHQLKNEEDADIPSGPLHQKNWRIPEYKTNEIQVN